MQEDSNMTVLVDASTSGRDRPWSKKKSHAINLYNSYSRLSEKLGEMKGNNVNPFFYKKRAAVYNCGNVLGFAEFEGSDDKKLGYAQFCRDRLCPMCSWRKSIKDFANLSKVIDVFFERHSDARAVFLTLTVRNPEPDALVSTLDLMYPSFSNLTKRRPFKRHVMGWFRALECNYKAPFAKYAPDTFHPHFHVMLMVDDSFFLSELWDYDAEKRNAIWREIWADCLGIEDYDYRSVLQVDCSLVRDREGVDWRSSVSEVAKYSVKDSDLFFGDDEVTDRAVYYLSKGLRGRRLIAYGGELRKIKRELNLVDADEGGDLVVTDDDSINLLIIKAMSFYGFNSGIYDYSHIATVELSEDGIRLSDGDYLSKIQASVLAKKIDEIPFYRRVESD